MPLWSFSISGIVLGLVVQIRKFDKQLEKSLLKLVETKQTNVQHDITVRKETWREKIAI